jgi:hypothetical protein
MPKNPPQHAKGRPRITPGSAPHCIRISDEAFDALRVHGYGSASAGVMRLYTNLLKTKGSNR